MGQASQRPRVLIVDDDVANLRVFARAFRAELDITTAASGPLALAAAAEGSPTVAFVDYTMPEMNGAAVLAALRVACPRLVCYLLTGYGDLPATGEVLRAGLCKAILAKPWDRATIREAVAHAVSIAAADGP